MERLSEFCFAAFGLVTFRCACEGYSFVNVGSNCGTEAWFLSEMQILVINSGSSSIKFSFFDAVDTGPRSVFEGEVSGIGSPEAKLSFKDAEGHDWVPEAQGKKARVASMDEAIAFVAKAVTGPEVPKIEAIGYRGVHPGPKLRGHLKIDDGVMEDLRKAAEFAPLHDPAALKIIKEMRRQFPETGHFACFDTVFHETMPPEATTYPLPEKYAEQGVRRYGFHGLACESVVFQLREAGVEPPRRMAIAHLGGGCSVTALLGGASVDTSMGLTPTGGIVMGTRPGDFDPGLMLWLVRQGSVDDVENTLNHKAGLAGMADTGDMQAVRAAAQGGDARAVLALQVFTRSVRKQIGGYMALLGGLDAIVFSGGIGEHDPASRQGILAGLEGLGILLDRTSNELEADGLRKVSDDGSTVAVYVVPAKEDLTIARHVARMSKTIQ